MLRLTVYDQSPSRSRYVKHKFHIIYICIHIYIYIYIIIGFPETLGLWGLYGDV